MQDTTERLKLSDTYPELAPGVAQRLHIKKDEIPFIRKYFIAEADAKDGDEDRTLVSRISCVNRDRDGESLDPSGVLLDHYRQNPIVCWGHSYNAPATIIGKNLWIKADEQGLIGKTVFAKNEFADQVYRAYTEDIAGTGPLLRGWSVGFIPLKWEVPKNKTADGPDRVCTKWELLEYSAVAIPCSPESLTLAYEKGIIQSAALRKDFDQPADEPVIEPTPEPEVAPDEPGAVDGVDGDADEDEAKAAPAPEDEPAPDILAPVMAELSALRAALAESDGQMGTVLAAVFELTERVEELAAKVMPPASDYTIAYYEAPAPEPEPEPAPAPDEPPAPDIAAAVAEAVRSLDLRAIVQRELTLALSKLRGRVEA